MDLFRNWFKSAAQKRQEILGAYVDGQLSARERQRFERELAGDAQLRQEVAQQQRIKSQLSHLPRQRAPRNFTLNPSLYSRPRPQPASWLYPAVRTATALAAFFFVVAVILELAALFLIRPSAAPVAMEVEQAPPAPALATPLLDTQMERMVEVTRVVTELIEPAEIEGATPEMAATDADAQLLPPSPAVAAEDEVPAEAPAGPAMANRLEATASPVAIPAPAIELPLTTHPFEPSVDEALPLSQPEVEVELLPETTPLSPWRIVQGALGVAVFILALTAVFLRRRHQ